MSGTDRDGAPGRDRLEALWQAARALPESERKAFLDACVGSNDALRRELESLLAVATTDAESFFARFAGVVDGSVAALQVDNDAPADSSTHADTDPLLGQTFKHYRIEARIGAGGMGVVYRAIDTHLQRAVALKFLPEHLNADRRARERFLIEARAAASLDHANICNIHEVADADQRRSFIAMTYYEGETLETLLERGPLPWHTALTYAIQIARGLGAAHERGIVHRDVKPANVMITSTGVVKLLDFGIARVTDVAGGTATGVTPGTLAYMSPEQVSGRPIDARTDLWSLGVLIHEMCTGARPFRGNTNAARMHAILNDPPATPSRTNAHVPREVDTLVARLLEKDPVSRYADAEELLADLTRAEQTSAPVLRPKSNRWLRPSVASTERMRPVLSGRWTIAALLALFAMAGLLILTIQRRGEERWGREEALPQLQALIEEDDYAGAFDLARQIERVTPNDPVLLALRPSFSAEVKLNTMPEGAKVFFRPYTSTEKDWRLIGETPLVDVAVPIGVGLWRIEKEGRDTALLAMRNPGVQLGNDPWLDLREMTKGIDFTIPLADAATSPEGMVLVPAIRFVIELVDDDSVEVPAFFIDRFEVSNREFKEFVDASGYAAEALWEDLPFDSGSGGWQPAVKQFVDLTGQPGSSTWEAGTYRDGTADYPVTGVSWFEAAAYCRYRGKEMPTAYHWYRAASSVLEFWESLASAIVHSSNYSGRELERVGRLGSLGPFGTYDMAGNAREWLWNQGSAGRRIAGGAFNDRPYQYTEPAEAPPSDRSDVNGIRCMRTMQGGPVSEGLRKPVASKTVNYAALEPVGDDAYSVLAQQLDYRSERLTPRVEEVNSSNPAWTRQRVELPTGYDTGKFAVHLFLPTGHAPPYQVVFYLPDGGYFSAPYTTDGFDPSSGGIPLDFLLKSGRAVAVVAFDGAYERQWPAERTKSTTGDERARTQRRHWRQELGRTIDYLATRKDFEAEKLGWFGVSHGAAGMVPLLAVEKRIGPAVLYSGGIGRSQTQPMSDRAFNYYPRVTQPVLMLNGRWDTLFPLPSQQRMLELLGTPEASKKLVLFEAGHGNLPRFQVQGATLAWFDRHLGRPAKK